ncbi:MAG TPA: hypothetical protein VI981_04880 [Candidatus Paceibacterota bacterium]
MEQPPSGERAPENRGEGELSFERAFSLAVALLDAVDTRNGFTEAHGGFDTFAETWQHVEGKRKEYDVMEEVVLWARREFDEKVHDKKAFVLQLRAMGRKGFADRIASMFGVSSEVPKSSRGGIFSRFRKKREKE